MDQTLLQLRTIGDLKRAGHRVKPVRLEMRDNLLERLRNKQSALPGIVGYDETVLPEIENGVLAGHHMILLGERGQAKSRIIRSLALLLDEHVAAIKGCEISDDPYAPICGRCRALVAEHGDETAIEWVARDNRYAEKLATPDVSVADLIGEIDPIKVAEGRYLADAETIHYGLIPRTNRGIFAINELPDLTEKVQVGLFNLMEEKDVQIKGYKIRLPVDVVFVASANPEDYTSRGRIITPLKDRFDIQIRTHYPKTIAHEIAIMEQECSYPLRAEMPLRVPLFMKEILAQVTFEARASNEINQASGVSVRVTINNYESVISNAEKRAIVIGDHEIVPRLSDLHSLYASTAGKIEIEYVGEDKKDDDLIERLINRAVLKVFDRYVKLEDLKLVIAYFEDGWGVEVSDTAPPAEYLDALREVPGLREAIDRLGVFETPGLMATASEFIYEGLHLHQKLNKERQGGRYAYHS
ncbi:MAG TPA: sigma 54-interacting transcriptional regulator [Candidatus Binataceae bacterium]|nr:sigma 54-interacting transcriptional regulator [Candidatus Binataceae bacterium]HVC44474.1 sigma 54-interacting transcriptional regulator [Candidatus Binataceae bacterium]